MSAVPAVAMPMPGPEAKASARDWLAVFGAILGAFTAILDIQITNASLADIQGALGASTEEGSWISTAYLMAEIIVIPLTGWLSSVIGLRRYLAVNTMLFTAFSLACALSTTLSQMILFRAGQGFTGGVLIPTAIVIVRTRLPKRQQTVGIALFGLTATFAPAIGPTVGGWLTDNLSWHYICYLNLLFGPLAAAIQLGAFDSVPARWGELLKGDWIGIGLMATGLPALTFVLEEGQRKDWFGSPVIVRASLLAAVGIAGFVLRELTAESHRVGQAAGGLPQRAGAQCAPVRRMREHQQVDRGTAGEPAGLRHRPGQHRVHHIKHVDDGVAEQQLTLVDATLGIRLIAGGVDGRLPLRLLADEHRTVRGRVHRRRHHWAAAVYDDHLRFPVIHRDRHACAGRAEVHRDVQGHPTPPDMADPGRLMRPGPSC